MWFFFLAGKRLLFLDTAGLKHNQRKEKTQTMPRRSRPAAPRTWQQLYQDSWLVCEELYYASRALVFQLCLEWDWTRAY